MDSPGDKIVYISSGGMAYHFDKKCSALQKGQNIVADRGGVLGSVQSVLRSRAVRLGRNPCRTCVK